MKRIIFIIILFFSITDISFSEEHNFTATDLSPYLEGLFIAETMQDWVQTTRFLRHGDSELDPLLGPHPSQAKMSAFGVGGVAVQFVGYELLSDQWKLPYAAFSALGEGFYVIRNKRLTGYPWDTPALGLGALVTGYLVYDYNKNHAHKVSMDIERVDKTFVPIISMTW